MRDIPTGRTRYLVLSLAAGLAAWTGGARAQQPAPGGAQPPRIAWPAGPTAAEKYKNIQVLKDVPADQIEATMHFIEAATGHRCVDCHVQEPTGQFSFDKDDKRPKATAREMIKIVKTVNDEFFKGNVNVTCATCHKGTRPQGQPPLAQLLTPEQVAAMAAQAAGGGRAQAAAPGAAAPRGGGQGGGGRGIPNVPIDDVLEKYLTAIGGRAALAKLQSVVMSGTVTNRAGQDRPFTIEEKGDKYRETIQNQPAPTTRAFDGTAGWLQSGAAVSSLGDFRLQEAMRISDLGRALAIRERYKGLRGARPPQIEGKTVVAMTGELSASVSETLVFDTATGLLIRRTVITKTPVGDLPEQIDYSDYRDVAGVKVPFQIKRATWEALDSFKVIDVKPNTQIADARFAKPM